MDLADGLVKKKSYRVTKSGDTKYLKTISLQDTRTSMSCALSNSKLRLNEAIALQNILYADGTSRIASLVNVLQRLENVADAQKLVDKTSNGTYSDHIQLKQALGPALKPLLGSFNGFYILDLSNEMDRLCLTRLVSQNVTEVHHRRNSVYEVESSVIGDTSQFENWSSFRNAVYKGQSIRMTPEMFQVVPREGSLSFDYSSISRPLQGSSPKVSREGPGDSVRSDYPVPLSDRRFVSILCSRKVQLLTSEKAFEAKCKLSNWKSLCSDPGRDCSPTFHAKTRMKVILQLLDLNTDGYNYVFRKLLSTWTRSTRRT